MKETKNLEFKSEITNTFLKTVSAFANFGRGVIEFGVMDNGEICGIDNPEQGRLDIENRINDSISPKPDYTLSINRKNNVITLTVSEGRYKPYLYKGKAYRRSDTATIEVDPIELKRLTLEGSNLYYEELAAEEDGLEFAYLEKMLIEKLGISGLTDDMLRTFGVYTKGGKLNKAAALLADKNAFPGIDISRFGKSVSEILDRETFAGDSVLKQYDDAVGTFKRYYQYDKVKGFERITVSTIPEEAFREAIANALIHRTWDVNANIRISMYPDRIEIFSPGGLPGGISKEEYLRGSISCLRNPILGNLFFRMHYIEMFGTGIRRIIESYEDSAIKPQFEVYDNSVVVILPASSQRAKVNTDGEKLLML